MCQVVRKEWGTWARVGMLLALLLVSSVPVRAQNRQTGGGSSRDDFGDVVRQMKETEDHDPSSGKIIRAFKSWVGLTIIAVVVVGVAVVVKVALWLFVPTSGTTDLDKLARSDPWLREQLARQKAAGGGPSGPQP